MNSSPNFADWSREKKDLYAESRMQEMREKNAKLMQRYAEVERDRINAEEHNSAVTKVIPKRERVTSVYDQRPERPEHAGEWDRGKPDKEHWRSPDHHASYKNYRGSRFEKSADKKGHWHSFSRNESTDQYRYDRGSDGMRNKKTKGNYNYKQRDSEQYQISSSSHLHMSPKRSRGLGLRNSIPQRKYQSSYSDEKFKKSEYNRSNSKKKYPYRAHSRSSSIRSVSDSDSFDNIANMQISLRASSLWENDKAAEDQNKQIIVEKWITNVHKVNNWPVKQFSAGKNSEKSYSKFDRFEKRSSSQSSVDDKCDTNFNAPVKENKSPGKYFSPQKVEFHETKFGLTPNKTIGGKQNAKRSPHFSSGGSNKIERKQQKFDSSGFKNYDTKDKYSKSKPFSPVARNLNAQFSACASYDRHEDDTWGNVKKDEYNPNDDEGVWAHVDQKSTDCNKKQSGNKVDDGWGHIGEESTHHKKEQYCIKVEDAGGIWSHAHLKDTHLGKKQSRPADDDEVWGDYQKDMSKLGFRKRTKEDDMGIWSNVVQDSHTTDKESASNKKKISVNCKKQSAHQNIDNNLHNMQQNVPAHKGKPSNKQFDDQADDGWQNVEQSGSKWKLSDEESDPQSADNQIQKCEVWEEKQTSEISSVKDKNKLENDSSHDKEANNSKFQDPVKLSDDSDNLNVAEDVSFPNLENTNVDEDEDEDGDDSLQKLSPGVNITVSTEESGSPSKRIVHVSDKQNISDGVSHSEKNQNDSDDGGWSTVSEGEVRSDDNGNEIEHCKTEDVSEK